MADVKVPELAESIHEGTIAEWLKGKGDYVEQGEAIVELETDKINVEVNSETSGVLEETLFEPGDTVKVGDVIAKIDESGDGSKKEDEKDQVNEKSESSSEKEEKEKEKAKVESSTSTADQEQAVTDDEKSSKDTAKQKPIASPAARKKARELGIDINNVKHTDPAGRVRTEDVINETKSDKKEKQEKPKSTEADEKPVERIKMSRRRQTIANRLVEAQQTAAMLTTFNEVDMSAVMDVRKRRKDAFQKKHDVKLGFMSFFTKAVVGALKEFPHINAEIQGNEIVLKKYYDIGIAVSAKEGLVVPVVRDADRLSFAEIEKNILNLAEKAKENKLGLGDLQGGSFTITNGGIFGSLYSTPILNTPQVGILGMHTIQRRPIVVDDQDTVEVRPMMYIALSYDHRIVDGSEAVSFLVRIKQLLEEPEDLLLEG